MSHRVDVDRDIMGSSNCCSSCGTGLFAWPSAPLGTFDLAVEGPGLAHPERHEAYKFSELGAQLLQDFQLSAQKGREAPVLFSWAAWSLLGTEFLAVAAVSASW